MSQQPGLWQHDAYAVLMSTESSGLGKRRLKRFLNWLDLVGLDWTRPDLERYGEYLIHRHNLQPSSVESEKSHVRHHYIAVLSNAKTLAYLALEERADFVNGVLTCLGYNERTLTYDDLVDYTQNDGSENSDVLLPAQAHDYRNMRLRRFIRWLDETGRHWSQPDLAEFRLTLKREGVSAVDRKNWIRLIRDRYEAIVTDDTILELLDPDEREAFKRELPDRLAYRVRGDAEYRIDDDPSNRPFWLSELQARAFIAQLETDTLIGLRNRAIIGLALYMGLQQHEIHNLNVNDLHYEIEGGRPALRVRNAQRTRLIPYDDRYPVREWLEVWLQAAEIEEGAIARTMYTNSSYLRPGRLDSAGMRAILDKYPVEVEGRQVLLLFPDLRCTYGRRLYDAGVDVETISHYLGFRRLESALRFLGLRKRRIR